MILLHYPLALLIKTSLNLCNGHESHTLLIHQISKFKKNGKKPLIYEIEQKFWQVTYQTISSDHNPYIHNNEPNLIENLLILEYSSLEKETT